MYSAYIYSLWTNSHLVMSSTITKSNSLVLSLQMAFTSDGRRHSARVIDASGGEKWRNPEVPHTHSFGGGQGQLRLKTWRSLGFSCFLNLDTSPRLIPDNNTL